MDEPKRKTKTYHVMFGLPNKSLTEPDFVRLPG